MDKNEIISKVAWFTQSKLAPQPITQEYKERQYRFFENIVNFLQDNKLTSRRILKKGEKATDESQIIIGDLTEEGIKFYAFGIRKWREKYDRAKDKDKAINDFYYIEKKLKEFREKQQSQKLPASIETGGFVPSKKLFLIAFEGTAVKYAATFHIALTEEKKLCTQQIDGQNCLGCLFYLSSDTEYLTILTHRKFGDNTLKSHDIISNKTS